MTNEQDYNGWTNYETWCVNLWIDNEPNDLADVARDHIEAALDGRYGYVREDVRADAVRTLGEHLEEMHDDAMPDVVGVFADLLRASLQEVNWQEIAEPYVKAIDLYSAGWNTPGYMPEYPPSLFVDADDALAYIRSEIERAADETDGEPIDLTTIKADAQGELGVMVGAYHYFITKV